MMLRKCIAHPSMKMLKTCTPLDQGKQRSMSCIPFKKSNPVAKGVRSTSRNRPVSAGQSIHKGCVRGLSR